MRYWYYVKNGSQIGPINDEDLKKEFVAGNITSETMVWTKDLNGWTMARDVENLIPKDFCPPPAPMLPPPLRQSACQRHDVSCGNQPPPLKDIESQTDHALETPSTTFTTPYVGLSGWLLLPAFAIVISPVVIIVGALWPCIRVFFNGAWEGLTTPGTENYTPFWGPLVVGETIINVGLIIAWSFLAFLFFSKKKIFPVCYIGLMAFTSLFMIVDAALTASVFPDQALPDQRTTMGIVRQLIGTTIWSWYMLVSKRVKATFVN